MEMQGSRTLAASQEQTWSALIDPEVLKQCIPGCDTITLTGENQYAIAMSVKIGPVSAKFNGKIALEDIVPPQSYAIAFEGQGGAAGFGKGRSTVKIEPRETGCELVYTAQAQVGGKIAQVGQRLIDGVAKSMAEDFFKRFEAVLVARHPEAVKPEPTQAIEQKSELSKPSKIPVWLLVVGVIVVGVILWKLL
jgi:uncharacterized protein